MICDQLKFVYDWSTRVFIARLYAAVKMRTSLPGPATISLLFLKAWIKYRARIRHGSGRLVVIAIFSMNEVNITSAFGVFLISFWSDKLCHRANTSVAMKLCISLRLGGSWEEGTLGEVEGRDGFRAVRNVRAQGHKTQESARQL